MRITVFSIIFCFTIVTFSKSDLAISPHIFQVKKSDIQIAAIDEPMFLINELQITIQGRVEHTIYDEDFSRLKRIEKAINDHISNIDDPMLVVNLNSIGGRADAYSYSVEQHLKLQISGRDEYIRKQLALIERLKD